MCIKRQEQVRPQQPHLGIAKNLETTQMSTVSGMDKSIVIHIDHKHYMAMRTHKTTTTQRKHRKCKVSARSQNMVPFI